MCFAVYSNWVENAIVIRLFDFADFWIRRER